MNKSWLDNHQEKILFFTWCFIILTCLLVIFTSPVKAASQTDGSLPYNVPQFRNANSFVPDEAIELALVRAESDARNFLNYQGDLTYLVFTIDGIVNDRYYDIYFLPNPSISDNVLSDYNFLDGTIRVWANDIQIQRVIVDKNNGSIGGGFINLGRYADLLGNSSTGSLNGGNFTPRYPFKMIGISEIKSANDVVVFTNTVSPVSISGHATEPINDPNNIMDNGSGDTLQRPTKPTPTPFTPQPFNPPSIDTSTLETLVESLIDVVEYGFNYIGGVLSGAFSNLLSNLGAWVDYIVQSFSYGFNNVVKAIQNLATDFYNNMVSLFEPLYEFFSGVSSFFNHLIEIGTVDGAFNLANIVTYLFLPEASAIYPIFVSHDEFNIIGITNHLFDEYRTMMSSVENINSLHYIMIPSFTFHGQTVPQTRIDFSWFDDYKVYTDGIISAFLIVGYVYFLFTRISGWLRGNQGDVYVGDNSSNYHGTKIGF